VTITIIVTERAGSHYLPRPHVCWSSPILKLCPGTARLRSAGSVLLGLAIALTLHSARAQTFADPGFVAETVTTLPPYQLVGIAWASTGTMFIWQKDGLVRAYHDGFLEHFSICGVR
jgi:hypothetical protein